MLAVYLAAQLSSDAPQGPHAASMCHVQVLPPLLLDRAAEPGLLGSVRDTVHVLAGENADGRTRWSVKLKNASTA